MPRVKRSTLAGTWYPGDRDRLRARVDELLAGVPAADPVARSSRLCGAVVPHAGYQYSGQAAAAAYACLAEGPYRRAVVVAPSHYGMLYGAAVLDVEAFETPLGRVRVDRAALRELLETSLFRADAVAFEPEHSLEIQLPFLQCVLPDVAVVPVLIGHLGEGDAERVGDRLTAVADPDTIVLVSSDFVHYGRRFDYLPFPARGPDEVRAGVRRLDMGAIERVCAGDAPGFTRYVAETGATICGRVPIAVFLSMHRRRSPGQLLTYYTSLDVTGDYEHCVSYASIAFPRPASDS